VATPHLLLLAMLLHLLLVVLLDGIHCAHQAGNRHSGVEADGGGRLRRRRRGGLAASLLGGWCSCGRASILADRCS
jgi:hypothetical protein